MPFLIDGHNLIGQMPDLSLSDPDDEAKLADHLKLFAQRTGKRVTVVFDPGPAGAGHSLGHNQYRTGNLTVIYAPPGRTADDIIRARIGEVKDKQGLIVVTSDSAVAGFTRMSGIRVESPRDFLKRMDVAITGGSSGSLKPHGSHREIENWADVFKEPETPPGARPGPPRFAKPTRKKRKKSEQLAAQIKRVRPLF